jgi:hypothetical protein
MSAAEAEINEGTTPMTPRTTSLTLAALVVATLASAAVPALAADRPGRDQNPAHGDFRAHGPRHGGSMQARDLRGGQRGSLLAFACSERGGDRLEHMLLTVAQRTDPTAEQQPLYDAFKSSALEAQAGFAAACETARSAAPADLSDRLAARLELDQARVAAMTDVLPAFDAFYDSLTDAQKQTFEPRARAGKRQFEGRRHQRPDTPAAPAAGNPG